MEHTHKPKPKLTLPSVPAPLPVDRDYIPSDPPPVSTPTVASLPPTPAWAQHVDFGVEWENNPPSPPASPMFPSRTLHMGFIGAGGINFGGAEGPWDHASRLERVPEVEFSAVVDVNLALAQKRIDERRDPARVVNGVTVETVSRWSNTQAFANYIDMLNSPSRPDAVFIGLPPAFHGALTGAAAVELECARRGVHVFVEKPISIRPVDEVEALETELRRLQKEKGVIVGVGYMLRYSPAVDTAVQILKEERVQPSAVLARYNCAYSNISKSDWWDLRRSGGPVVEQATHFVDLMRLFGGAVDMESVQSMCVGPSSELGNLTDMPAAPGGEHNVPPAFRINRVSSAQFRYKNGGIGQLTHALLLHGDDYATELEVWGDGLRLIIRDPYNNPALLVRRPGSEIEENVTLPSFELYTPADMYMVEVACFVHAIRTKDTAAVRSPFKDALETYRLTKIITERAAC